MSFAKCKVRTIFADTFCLGLGVQSHLAFQILGEQCIPAPIPHSTEAQFGLAEELQTAIESLQYGLDEPSPPFQGSSRRKANTRRVSKTYLGSPFMQNRIRRVKKMKPGWNWRSCRRRERSRRKKRSSTTRKSNKPSRISLATRKARTKWLCKRFSRNSMLKPKLSIPKNTSIPPRPPSTPSPKSSNSEGRKPKKWKSNTKKTRKKRKHSRLKTCRIKPLKLNSILINSNNPTKNNKRLPKVNNLRNNNNNKKHNRLPLNSSRKYHQKNLGFPGRNNSSQRPRT